MPEGAARTEMFKRHFANIGRLAGEKKLVLAGPLDGVDGLRGVFVFATPDIEQARADVETIRSSSTAKWRPNFTSFSAWPG